MPAILELKKIDGELWARILDDYLDGEAIVLWTETEKKEALARERRRCITALENLEADIEAIEWREKKEARSERKRGSDNWMET